MTPRDGNRGQSDGNRGQSDGNRGQSENLGVFFDGKAWAGVKGLACHENREWNMRERSIM